jgi:DNA segregation ATPase FtsK/SpoIIIE-like protein
MADKDKHYPVLKRFKDAKTGEYRNKGDLVPLDAERAEKLAGRGLVKADPASAADVKAHTARVAERQAEERAKAEERLATDDRSGRPRAGRGPTVSAVTGDVIDPGTADQEPPPPEPDDLDDLEGEGLLAVATAEEVTGPDNVAFTADSDPADVRAAIRAKRQPAPASEDEKPADSDTRKPRR